MNLMNLWRSGKNPKWLYYLKNYGFYLLPKYLFRQRIKRLVENLAEREDLQYIHERLNYYNAMPCAALPSDLPRLRGHQPKRQKVYFFDSYRYTCLFPQDYLWSFLPGDIIHVPNIPTIVKSRPLHVDNHNSVLMKLDKVRHFIFVKDEKRWGEKRNEIIFRGKVLDKEIRRSFMKMYFKHPLVDAADVGKHADNGWRGDYKSIAEHLDYKFIMALEGNDVASNLKWIMSSNSLAVMPRPSCETWFMEGRLIPNVHYVEIKPDLSDLIERVKYYLKHPEKAEAIIRNAQKYVSQFLDDEREDLISYLVLDRYFERSGQKKK